MNAPSAMCNMCYQSTDQVGITLTTPISQNSLCSVESLLFSWLCQIEQTFPSENSIYLLAQMKTKPLYVNIAVVFRLFFFQAKFP